MPRGALALAGLLLAAGFAGFALWLAAPRPAISTTPSPAPLTRERIPVVMAAGEELCLDPVVLDSRSEEARIWLEAPGAGTRLRLTLTTPGGEQTSVVTPGPAGPVTFPLRPPPDEVVGRACLITEGGVGAALRGTRVRASPANPRPEVALDGQPVGEDVMLAFYEREPRSLLARLPLVGERLARYRPAGVEPWTFAVLAFLVVVGMPLGVGVALARGGGFDRGRSGGRRAGD